MQHEVEIKATGENASGKMFLLEKIISFLEKEGYRINKKGLKDNHEIGVVVYY
ncbi:MAG TPA: hypothetical protein PK255_03605 [Candidatus Pacearchaeota archaeon]|nr:hypothetical protein [Candidatus Pacearchaeota archaeon]HQI57582.1 hypothetical protein [Candidatus Pacearchaeota archaeon]HQJ58144.1 hypothetical protein [Candidatus Pacearchaeota archaeon]